LILQLEFCRTQPDRNGFLSLRFALSNLYAKLLNKNSHKKTRSQKQSSGIEKRVIQLTQQTRSGAAGEAGFGVRRHGAALACLPQAKAASCPAPYAPLWIAVPHLRRSITTPIPIPA
jgi:hypothetical protein